MSESPTMDHNLSLESQVAQRLVLGFDGSPKDDSFSRFLNLGLGGVIFFRENFEDIEPAEPASVARLLTDISQAIPESFPRPFLTLDEEGGQVERLPHRIFPTFVSPMSVALALKDTESNEFCAEVYDMNAYYLSLLGFNMNLFPTLDVNLEKSNPIIGPRSFGENPDTVWRFAKVALERMEARKILAVGKHFPGHGNGTIDSHEDLPTLNFTDQELTPFRQAIENQLPAMMIAHGHYPAIQEQAGESGLPASASRAIIQDLLREDLGFDGLVLSDDMCMGAITKHHDPVEAAIMAMDAGIDVLIYRESTETQWKIHQGIVEALSSGRLDKTAHEESLNRILRYKSQLPPLSPNYDTLSKVMSPPAIEAVSSFIAGKAITPIFDNGEFEMPVDPEDVLWVIHPDRGEIPSYYPDIATSPELPQLLEEEGLHPVHEYRYIPGEPIPLPELKDGESPPEVVVFVTFNPQLNPGQTEFYEALRKAYPEVFILLVSAGTAYDREWMPEVDIHFAMCSYRPASLRALAEKLARKPEPEPQRGGRR